MICPACHRELPDDSRFCNGCGVAVEPGCPRCGQSNAVDSRFCRSCGAALARIDESASAPPATADWPRADAELDLRAHDGERRHLTVVFCDLVGSTEFASRLDPEEWRDIVRRYQGAAAEVVSRYGGHLEQYLGDGVLAYFGWPVAHDDDAERAVRSGLALRDAVNTVNERLVARRSPRLSVRVGVHTGPVVVADAGGAFGETPNIAARVQAAAEPDSVVISEDTQRLVSGLFVVDALGLHTLKGVAAPMPLYRVVQPSGVRGRLGAAAARGLTPFVGREEERHLLRARFEQSQEGDGQLVLVTGEAGIGKSRLLQALKEDLASTPHSWIECACSPFFANTPFRPVTEMLQQAFGWEAARPAEGGYEDLVRALEAVKMNATETARLVAPLLGLSPPTELAPLPLSSAQQRRRLLATLEEWVFAIARLQPAVLLVEDLHWADASTLELLGILAEQGATVPLFLVATAREEFRAPWPRRAHHSQLTLNRLSRRHVRAMIRQVVARSALSDEVVEAVLSRTDGVPLFIEELTRLVLENEGREGRVGREIPTTLEASLTARLDRLGPAKELAQLGAVIGREFSYALIRAASDLPELELQAALVRLADSELLHARGLPPDATYLFKHALVQDAAYASLLKSRRRELHGRIAHELVERFLGQAMREPEVLAHHLTEAGDAAPAVNAWLGAGIGAANRCAYGEAVGHLSRGIAVLQSIPETPERTEQEINLLGLLSQTLFASKGFAAPEAAAVAEKAWRLSEKLGDSPMVFVTLVTLCTSFANRAELRSAGELAERLVMMADHLALPGMKIWAHFHRGLVRFYGGDPGGREDFERALELDDRGGEPGLGITMDPAVLATIYSGLSAWQLGLPDTARERVQAGIGRSRTRGQGFEMALAQSLAGILDFYLREPPREGRLEHLDALLRVGEEHHMEQVVQHATVQRGWGLVQLGRHEEGVAALRQGVATARETGGHTLHHCYALMLAEALGIAGAESEALAALEDGLQASGEMEREKADYLRLRADLLVRLDAGGAEIETAYRDAIGLARRQGSRSYELRAATHLGCWLRARGRGEEARALVEPLYGWFTEGADTRDLREARALLDALA